MFKRLKAALAVRRQASEFDKYRICPKHFTLLVTDVVYDGGWFTDWVCADCIQEAKQRVIDKRLSWAQEREQAAQRLSTLAQTPSQ